MTLGVQGVGGVKVQPAWNGGGTVRLVIQDSHRGVPSALLVSQVQEAVNELAPIGHSVTVVPAVGFVINVSAQFILVSGLQFSDIKSELEDIVGEYLHETACNWDKSDGLVVRASYIEARLLNHSGIVDIANLSLNGGVSGRNITLSDMQIPVRGAVINVS